MLEGLRWFFSSKGRMSRSETLLSVFLALIVFGVLAKELERAKEALGIFPVTALQFCAVLSIFVVTRATANKRRHDLGMPNRTILDPGGPYLFFRKGMANANAYGPVPSWYRRWVLLGLIVAFWMVLTKVLH